MNKERNKQKQKNNKPKTLKNISKTKRRGICEKQNN